MRTLRSVAVVNVGLVAAIVRQIGGKVAVSVAIDTDLVGWPVQRRVVC